MGAAWPWNISTNRQGLTSLKMETWHKIHMKSNKTNDSCCKFRLNATSKQSQLECLFKHLLNFHPFPIWSMDYNWVMNQKSRFCDFYMFWRVPISKKGLWAWICLLLSVSVKPLNRKLIKDYSGKTIKSRVVRHSLRFKGLQNAMPAT